MVAATATYAAIALGVAQVSSIAGAGVPDLAALGWAALVAVVGLGWGAASGAGLLAPLGDRLPAAVRRAALVAGVSGAALVVAAGAVSVVALVARWSTVTGLGRQVAPGALEAVELLLVSIVYLPNLLLWALSYLAGPGFAAGGGATIDPFSASGALLPGIPLLGAIPVDAPPAAPLLLLLPGGGRGARRDGAASPQLAAAGHRGRRRAVWARSAWVRWRSWPRPSPAAPSARPGSRSSARTRCSPASPWPASSPRAACWCS